MLVLGVHCLSVGLRGCLWLRYSRHARHSTLHPRHDSLHSRHHHWHLRHLLCLLYHRLLEAWSLLHVLSHGCFLADLDVFRLLENLNLQVIDAIELVLILLHEDLPELLSVYLMWIELHDYV